MSLSKNEKELLRRLGLGKEMPSQLKRLSEGYQSPKEGRVTF